MISRWLLLLNYGILSLALLLGLGGVVYWIRQPAQVTCANSDSKFCGLPRGSFELKEEAYQDAGISMLELQEAPPAMHLPDLRQQLIYYGKNGRPDAQSEHTLLHFSLSGNNKAVASITPGGKLYLIYDRKSSPSRYSFSPENEKTSLWIEANLEQEALISVMMENEKGERITEPEAFAQFRLPEKEFIRATGGVTWEIGSFRVDGTLLARQRARWSGGDRFLERHGGEDFQNIEDKQRIDLGENDDLYSVFVKAGDCLIWNENKWRAVQPGGESLGYPLLVVKKIDERLMAFELWDVEGRGKILLNLLKSSEPWAMQNGQGLQNMFKFLGAHTKTQCIFEINRERVILRPSDWLLLTPKGWKKIETNEEIDNYVKRKLTGTLFVFEGIARKEDRQVMLGKLYSPSRHECQEVELPLIKGGVKPPLPKDGKEKEGKEGEAKNKAETFKG